MGAAATGSSIRVYGRSADGGVYRGRPNAARLLSAASPSAARVPGESPPERQRDTDSRPAPLSKAGDSDAHASSQHSADPFGSFFPSQQRFSGCAASEG